MKFEEEFLEECSRQQEDNKEEDSTSCHKNNTIINMIASNESPKRPVSVLRKVGSSKCLQQDFQPNTNNNKGSSGGMDKTVTLLNLEDLPSFSTERYYMLSEIEMKGHSIHFLSDLYGLDVNHDNDDDDDLTQDMSTSSHSLTMDQDVNCAQPSSNNYNIIDENVGGNENSNSTQSNQQQSRHLLLPPCIILYLLWRPDCIYDTSSAYAENVIQPAIQKILDLYHCPSSENGGVNDNNDVGGGTAKNKSLPNIYITIDRIVVSNHLDQIQEGRETDYDLRLQQSQEKKETQISIAETLIRKVSTDSSLNLRQIIHGISIGLSDNIRAAPGLELCMDAILVGDAERRRFANKWKKSTKKKNENTNVESGAGAKQEHMWTMDKPCRSSIGIFTEYTDDLTGLDPKQDTDAAQNDLLLHVRCNGGWEGKGNIMNFAFLSQKVWKQHWDQNEREMNDDDYLLRMYSIIMGRYGGGKNKRRTGRRSKNSKRLKDDTSFQGRFLPSKSEQQSVERTADVMILVLLVAIGYSLWHRHSRTIIEYIQIRLDYAQQLHRDYMKS